MAGRNGSGFLGRLAAARVHVEIQGETLTGGVAAHPAFRNVVRSFAELYEMQHDPAYRDILTYPSPATGEPVPRAGRDRLPHAPDPPAPPKAQGPLQALGRRLVRHAGRTGDYLNSALMALA